MSRMDHPDENKSFNSNSNDVNQFSYHSESSEAVNPSGNVSSMLSNMVGLDAHTHRSLNQPTVMFQAGMAQGLELQDFQQLQNQRQMSLNLDSALPTLHTTSQPVAGPSGVSQLFLPNGMNFTTRAVESLLNAEVSQRLGSVEIAAAAQQQVLPSIANMSAEQMYVSQNIPLLPATTGVGGHNMQTSQRTTTNHLVSMPILPVTTCTVVCGNSLQTTHSTTTNQLASMLPATTDVGMHTMHTSHNTTANQLASLPMLPATTDVGMHTMHTSHSTTANQLASLPMLPATTDVGMHTMHTSHSTTANQLTSLPVLPVTDDVHVHVGAHNLQPTRSATTSHLASMSRLNILPSIMSTRLSSGSRSYNLTAVSALSMLNFPSVSQGICNPTQVRTTEVVNNTQVSNPERYVSPVQIAASQSFTHSHTSVSPAYTNAPSIMSRTYIPSQLSQNQSSQIFSATTVAQEPQNYGVLPSEQSSQSSLGLEISNIADPSQLIPQQQPELQLEQHQVEQQPELDQHHMEQHQMEHQHIEQLHVEQQQLGAHQQPLAATQMQALSAEAEPTAVVHHRNITRTLSLPLGGMLENSPSSIQQASIHVGQASSNSVQVEEPQPGPSSASASSQVFYHKATGKNVRIPSGTEAVASSTNSQQNQENSSLSFMDSHSEPSRSYSSSMFESLSPPDSTTHINVNDFLNDPSHALSELAASSSGARYADPMSNLQYKEDTDGVSSTSEDHHLELLMHARLGQSLGIHQHDYPGSLSNVNLLANTSNSHLAAARLLDNMNNLSAFQRSSPKCDDDSNMPSSSGILPSAGYESISDDEDSGREVTTPRDNVTIHRVQNMCKSPPDDSLSSSLDEVHPGTSRQQIASIPHSLHQISTTQSLYVVADFDEGSEAQNHEVAESSRSEADAGIQQHDLMYRDGDGVHSSTLIQADSGNFFYQENNIGTSPEVFNTAQQQRDTASNSEVASSESSPSEQNNVLQHVQPTGSHIKYDEFGSINVEQHEDLFNRSQPHFAVTNSLEISSIHDRNVMEATPGTSGLQFVNCVQPISANQQHVVLAISDVPEAATMPDDIKNDVNLAEGIGEGQVVDSDTTCTSNKLQNATQSANLCVNEVNSVKSLDVIEHDNCIEVSFVPEPVGEPKELVAFEVYPNVLLTEDHSDTNAEENTKYQDSVGNNVKQERQSGQIVPETDTYKLINKKDMRKLKKIPVVDQIDERALDKKANEAPTTGSAMKVQVKDSQRVYVDGTFGQCKWKWKCLLCPKMYTSKHNLVSHILSHNGIKPFHCAICGKYFKQAGHLYQHILTHGNVKPYLCNFCDRSFTQASHLKRHMAIHMEKRPNVCHICDRGFVYPSELKAHVEKHQLNGIDYSCDQCEDSCKFDSAKKLKQHMISAHGDVSDLTCKQCGKVFPYPSQLRDHMAKHSGHRPFQCGECGTEFLKEHHLKAHQFTHTGLRPFICDTSMCGRAFNQKANLHRHMLIHRDDKKYQCEVCKKTFSQPQVLKAHMVTHADDKPYKCAECGKKFTRAHNLNGHMHIHRGNKPHVCFCSASFTLKGNLNRHKKEKHGITDTTQSTEEEAAKILNEMSTRKVYNNDMAHDETTHDETTHDETTQDEITQDGITQDDIRQDGFVEQDETGYSSEGMSTPKKKRKSAPPRKSFTQVVLDDEAEAVWDSTTTAETDQSNHRDSTGRSHPSTRDPGNSKSCSMKHLADPSGQLTPLTTTKTVATDVIISKLMGSMTGEYRPPGDKHKHHGGTFHDSAVVEISTPDVIIETETLHDDMGQIHTYMESSDPAPEWNSLMNRKRSRRGGKKTWC